MRLIFSRSPLRSTGRRSPRYPGPAPGSGREGQDRQGHRLDRSKGGRANAPESRGSTLPDRDRHQPRKPGEGSPGPAGPRLVQNGWTVFLVKVHNEAGVTAELQATSPNAEPVFKQSTSSAEPKKSIRSTEITRRWMDLAMFRDRPLKTPSSLDWPSSTGSTRFTAATPASEKAKFSFNVGQGRRGSRVS